MGGRKGRVTEAKLRGRRKEWTQEEGGKWREDLRERDGRRKREE